MYLVFEHQIISIITHKEVSRKKVNIQKKGHSSFQILRNPYSAPNINSDFAILRKNLRVYSLFWCRLGVDELAACFSWVVFCAVLVDQKHFVVEYPYLKLQDVFTCRDRIVKCKHTIAKRKQHWANRRPLEQTKCDLNTATVK